MKEKGIDELFEAAKKIKTEYGGRIVFDLVGFYEDEYKEVVEQLVKNGIVRFHGFQSDPRAFYAMSHCVVLPSYHEGMSNVLLEAASMGRALICSDIPGCREAVEEGKNGYLCKRMDENSLYSCMKLFIELDENQRRAMGHYGRKKMEKEFDKEEVVKRTVDKILQ